MNEVVIESLDAINERMAIELKVMEQNLDLDDQIEAYESLLAFFENGEACEEEEAPEDWEEFFCPKEEAELSF